MTAHSLQMGLLGLISLSALLQLLGKGWLICLLGLYLYRDMELSAAAAKNRIVVGVIVCMAALPVLGWVAPVLQLPFLPREQRDTDTAAYSWAAVLVCIYLLIALVMACKLLLQIVRIATISMRSLPAPGEWLESLQHLPAARKVKIRTSAQIGGAMTWGVIRPTILLPLVSTQWSEAERKLILRHELAHIERGDWLIVLLARWVCILYWPLPGLRSLFKRLSLSAEQACDDRVLASGGDPTDYASVLVKQVRGDRLPATLALAQPSELAIRVRYLIADIVDRSTLDPQRRWVYPLCAVLVYPLATVTVVAEPKILRVVPLNRAVSQTEPTVSPPISTAAASIVKPPPPATVSPPPPKLNLIETSPREGDKPSIPPP